MQSRLCSRTIFVALTSMVVAISAAAQGRDSVKLEHLTAIVDGHPFAVWASRPAHPGGSILLVHGRTWSARPAFDLHLSHENRSVLARLSAAGYAAYAVDLRGYGETPRDSSGWLTPRRSATDVEGVLRWIATQNPQDAAPILVGWSRGSRIAAMVATRGKVPLSALVLSAYTYDPNVDGQPVPPDSTPARARNTAKAAASDFKTPAVATQETIDAFVTTSLATNLVRVDLKGEAVSRYPASIDSHAHSADSGRARFRNRFSGRIKILQLAGNRRP